MRVFASLSPWLPLLKDFLPSVLVLEEKAAELYHLSLLGKPVASDRIHDTMLAVEKGGKALQKLHDHLLQQRFQRRLQNVEDNLGLRTTYFREDLGSVQFLCPWTRPNQKPAHYGLSANPDKRVAFLLPDPHSVDVHYLSQTYEVLVPQVGRFVLTKGLGLKTGRRLNPNRIYQSAQDLMTLLDLLVAHEELQEEVLNDFLDIRPPALMKEFIGLLRKNGPGTVLWESAQRLYLQRYPDSKAVLLTRWYWDFLPRMARFLEKQKDSTS